MTGSGLAQLIIPLAVTLGLSAWLALVFYAGRRPWRADGNPAPGQESPGPAALAAPRLPDSSVTDLTDLRGIVEVQR